MPLYYYKNIKTGALKKSLKPLDSPEYIAIITVPETKFMVRADNATGKSKLKDQTAMLRKRARDNSRANDLDDTIQISKEAGTDAATIAMNFLDPLTGQKRKKISDI